MKVQPHSFTSFAKIMINFALFFCIIYKFLFYSEFLLESGNEELPKPLRPPLDAVWQQVLGTRFKFYVYSAFMEWRTGKAEIRIIAVTKTDKLDPVVCRLWLSEKRSFTFKAEVLTIRENRNLAYSAAFVMCRLSESGLNPQELVGASVSVVSIYSLLKPPSNTLPILDTQPKSGIEEILHVCVKPFYFSYSRVTWLMEWFEMNRLLGVSHFYMYNESLSASVACLLEQYKQQGLVTLLPWKLPFVSLVEIRTQGLFAAFNDCLYRSMPNAGWLLVIDLDELVIPRKKDTLLALLTKELTPYTHTSCDPPSVFMFRNTFFYTAWEDDPEAKTRLLTAKKTRRWKTPHKILIRSKYIVNPQEVVELGNHCVWEYLPGAYSIEVPADHALLHHYRTACENGGMMCLDVKSSVDRTALQWSDELLQKTDLAWASYSTVCGLYK